MADKISRRSFLKGTGKTILTAGALSSGIGLSTSTTPKTVAISQKGIRWTNLNVLTPRAKAYRSYLRGIRSLGAMATGIKDSKNRGKIRSFITKLRMGSGKNQAIAQRSPARQAFTDSTQKISKNQPNYGRNLSSDIVARQIAPDPQAKIPPSQRTKSIWERNQKAIARDLTKRARGELARELRKQRKLTKAAKIPIKKGAKVGGGGKMALPGLESAKNPTGMSLVTQRYTL